MANNLTIGALSPDKVFETLVKKGLDKSDAAVFVGEWLVGEFGGARRSFDYVQAFVAEKPECEPKFVRGFAHKDWVDGEDTVQAGETAGEEGFNRRFHAIEKDLDSLGQDAAHAFACMAEMRRELRSLLNEIRNEFNRLNGLLDKKQPGVIGPVSTLPGVVSAGTLLGTIKFNDKPMTLWQTAAGMMMLPSADVINPNPLENPRAVKPGQFAKYIESKPEVRAQFGGVLTKEEFLGRFGNDRLEDGTPVRDLIDTLPAGARFANLAAMVGDLIEREAAALRTTEGVEAIVSTTLGIDINRENPGGASIEKFNAIPSEAREALIREGIDTVGKLSEAGAQRVQEVLRGAGIRDVSIGDAADWSARATTISRLGRHR